MKLSEVTQTRSGVVMVDGVGVVGSSKEWAKRTDFFGDGATPETELVSDMNQTIAMFVDVRPFETVNAEERKQLKGQFKKDEISVAAHFLMPNNILVKAWLTRSDLKSVSEGLVQRDIPLRKYICYGKPYIPTGDLRCFGRYTQVMVRDLRSRT